MALGSNSTGNWQGAYFTYQDIADDPRVAVSRESLMVMLSNGTYPPIRPDAQQFGGKLFLHSTVEAWIASLEDWRSKAGERAAAKRAAKKAAEAAESARIMAANEREIAAMKRAHDVMQQGLEADRVAREQREQAHRDQMDLVTKMFRG